MSANQYPDLDHELDLWKHEGKTARIWWRDDDAVARTDALEALSALSEGFNVPVLLAVIPRYLDASLVNFVNEKPNLSVGVHGYAHKDHSTPDQKKTELTLNLPARTLEMVLGELEDAKKIIANKFGPRASQILVPPWNRIDTIIADQLKRADFKILSGFTQKALEADIKQLNCHLDLMHWKPERKGKQSDEVIAELALRLREARGHGFKPIGILSHHLVHDEAAWNASKTLMEIIHSNPNIGVFSIEDYRVENGL